MPEYSEYGEQRGQTPLKSEDKTMEENRKKRNRILSKEILKRLEIRGIEGYYADSKQEALTIALNMIPEGSVVGWGGSASISEIGLKQAVSEGNYKTLNRDVCKTPEEKRKIELACFDSDYFLASVNAVTYDGELVNIDKIGNRIACIAYGSKHVILVVGMNKAAKSYDEAVSRAHNEAAPINAVRLNTDTPCCTKGMCYDCKGSKSNCCQVLITRSCAAKGRMKLILVNEDLGF